MIAPVAGSGSCPAWMARVSNSMRPMLPPPVRVTASTPTALASSAVALHPLEAENAYEPRRGALQRVVEPAANLRLRREPPDPQHALRSVRLEIRAPNDPVVEQEREDVVAVDTLVLALVDLDHVLEAEHARHERAVPHQVVERAQQDRP